MRFMIFVIGWAIAAAVAGHVSAAEFPAQAGQASMLIGD